MDYSRRDLSVLLPALFAVQANTRGVGLVSRVYPFDSLTAKTSANGLQSFPLFNGRTHEGLPVDMHISELAPGQMPHPPHRHFHEEVVMMIDGTLEVTIAGKAVIIGHGGSAYVNSNDDHGWKNNGKTVARYFVLAIGRDSG